MNFDLRTLKNECIQCTKHIQEMFNDGADDTKHQIKIGNRIWLIYASDYDDFIGVKVFAYDKDNLIYEYRYGGKYLDGSTLFKNIVNAETEED